MARGAVSYNLTKLAGGTLGLGLDIGIMQKSISASWIVPEPLKNDPRIPGSGGSIPGVGDAFNNPNLNKITYDLGAGVFYNIPGKFYLGLSSTHLPAQQVKGAQDLRFQVSRHYYLMTGYTFQPTKWSKITPNVLYKTDIAGSSLDANLTFLWSDMIWIGGTYRLNDAAAVLLGYQGVAGVGNSIGYKIGFSYDFTTAALKTYTKGSVEAILGVCYTPKISKPTTYGSDRFLD
jgi:type IX secretion system PorP/SprF family membrane protein